MSIYLFAFFTSFLVNLILIVPFIDLLYKMKFQRVHQETRDAFDKKTPIFDKYHSMKVGIPVGGGVLTVFTTLALFVFFITLFLLGQRQIISNYSSVISEIKILLFTIVSFSFLGLYDDLKKIFFLKDTAFFGLRLRHKLLVEIFLGFIISYWMYSELKINIIHIPFLGVYAVSWLYILFSTFVIVSFANAINISDGLDGMASGVLTIALLAFWAVSVSILDTPLLVFIAVWLGGLIAFLYFNIYPARIMLGDTGSLAFRATFAVIGLLLGKAFALPIIGGVFVIEIASSLIQLLSKRFFNKKAFPVAPLHLWLQLRGWGEPKVVMRSWIVAALFATFGLMVAFMK